MSHTNEPTPEDQKDQTKLGFERGYVKYQLMDRYYSELSRFSTWMFSSVIVAMTFLLLAGLRSPHVLLLVFMYGALGAFSLSLLAYLLAHWFKAQLMMKKESCEKAKQEGDDKLERLEKEKVQAKKWLKVVRVSQQVLFAIGLVAIVGFSIEVSLLFFVPATSAAAGQ